MARDNNLKNHKRSGIACSHECLVFRVYECLVFRVVFESSPNRMLSPIPPFFIVPPPVAVPNASRCRIGGSIRRQAARCYSRHDTGPDRTARPRAPGGRGHDHRQDVQLRPPLAVLLGGQLLLPAVVRHGPPPRPAGPRPTAPPAASPARVPRQRRQPPAAHRCGSAHVPLTGRPARPPPAARVASCRKRPALKSRGPRSGGFPSGGRPIPRARGRPAHKHTPHTHRRRRRHRLHHHHHRLPAALLPPLIPVQLPGPSPAVGTPAAPGIRVEGEGKGAI